MPDLADLPSGTSVFVDTNIFDLHFRSKSLSCVNFINRIALGEVEAYVNIQVLCDLLHKLMLAEAYSKSYISVRSASKLKQCFQARPALAANLVNYQIQFEQTLQLVEKPLNG